jgi:drug/metabolite transporter (DMT)-like permease
MFRTGLLTAAALVAFAANSVLCRLALSGGGVDAASFGAIRLASGAATLALIHLARRGARPANRGWIPPLMLFAYVAAFSFAYVSVSAGTGALLLFGAVQATMIVVALRTGERFAPTEAVGLSLALGGLAYLVLPGVTAPSPTGSCLMIAAGVAWGVYSLRGRGSRDPLGDTARNFALATPLALVVCVATHADAHVDARGAWLAVCSGAVTSGLGYVVWFAALRGLSAIRAATVQLAVPALAATGGVVFLGEEPTLRLVVAAALILGGVGVAVAGRARRAVPT